MIDSEEPSAGLSNLFDMDLEGLDFETAYELINEKADHWSEMNDNLNIGLAESQMFDNVSHQGPKSAVPSRPETPHAVQQPFHQGFEAVGNTHTDELLSVNESHAIESFLDSLLTASPSKPINMSLLSPRTVSNIQSSGTGSISSPNFLFENQQLQQTDTRNYINKFASERKTAIHDAIKEELTPKHTPDSNVDVSEDSKDNDVSDDGSSMELPMYKSLESYEPVEPKIPLVEIPEGIIPPGLKKNTAELRKWKHVYLEKQRRNTFKQEYDALIGLIKYPRPDWHSLKSSLPKTKDVISLDYKLPKKEGKRVPKHTLLNYIIQDIQLLLLANEELEKLCLK